MAGRGDESLHDHADGAPVDGPLHEVVAVVPLASEGDEDLARLHAAAIGRGAGDDEVATAQELGLREQPAETDGRDAPTRAGALEPASHRLLPPCLGLAIRSESID